MCLERKPQRAFVVHDRYVIASSLAALLRLQGFDARSFTNALEALLASPVRLFEWGHASEYCRTQTAFQPHRASARRFRVREDPASVPARLLFNFPSSLST